MQIKAEVKQPALVPGAALVPGGMTHVPGGVVYHTQGAWRASWGHGMCPGGCAASGARPGDANNRGLAICHLPLEWYLEQTTPRPSSECPCIKEQLLLCIFYYIMAMSC